MSDTQPTAQMIKTAVSLPVEQPAAGGQSNEQKGPWQATPEMLMLVSIALMLGIALRRHSAGKQ